MTYNKKVLGMVLGLALGVLVDSCLVIILSPFIIFISPVLLAPPIIGIICGLVLSNIKNFPEISWPKIFLGGIVVLILAAMTPYFLSIAELHLYGATTIPTPKSSFSMVTKTNPLGSSWSGPSISHIFESDDTNKDIISFYSSNLMSNGWKQFEIEENRAWFTKSSKDIIIKLTGRAQHTKVKVTYSRDRILAPWVVLIATFACVFYFNRGKSVEIIN